MRGRRNCKICIVVESNVMVTGICELVGAPISSLFVTYFILYSSQSEEIERRVKRIKLWNCWDIMHFLRGISVRFGVNRGKYRVKRALKSIWGWVILRVEEKWCSILSYLSCFPSRHFAICQFTREEIRCDPLNGENCQFNWTKFKGFLVPLLGGWKPCRLTPYGGRLGSALATGRSIWRRGFPSAACPGPKSVLPYRAWTLPFSQPGAYLLRKAVKNHSEADDGRFWRTLR